MFSVNPEMFLIYYLYKTLQYILFPFLSILQTLLIYLVPQNVYFPIKGSILKYDYIALYVSFPAKPYI